jgi:hypothetical protein
MCCKSYLCAIAALICFCVLAPPVEAGQLFPPANIGSNPNIACPNSEVLAWTGETVACVNPTPGVSVSCTAGQVLMGISNGLPVCTSVPSCQAGQTLNYDGTTFVCTASAIPTCAADQVISFNGKNFVCVNQDPAVPTCATGQFLTYNGVAFQCSGTQSLSLPACGANQYVTSNGSQFSCVDLPATSGGGQGCPAQQLSDICTGWGVTYYRSIPALTNSQVYFSRGPDTDIGGQSVPISPTGTSPTGPGSTPMLMFNADYTIVYQCQNGQLVQLTAYACGSAGGT